MDYSFCRRVLFSLDAQTARRLVLTNLDWIVHLGLHRHLTHMPDDDPVTVMGLRFPNAVGLSAGMDRNGKRVNAFGGLGCGHVEVGTVTPLPEKISAKPALFRLVTAQGLIHRAGLDNDGVHQVIKNLRLAAPFRLRGGILGISIGKNSQTPADQALADFQTCLDAVYDHADYIAVNLSSPDAKSIAALEEPGFIEALLSGIAAHRDHLKALRNGKHVPMAVKLSPDWSDSTLTDVLDQMMKFGFDGVIATNATLTRDAVVGMPDSGQTGGLTGAPLRERATRVVRLVAEHVKGALPIIATGGIMSADDALEKMQAGAQLVQVHTGVIYQGPALIADSSDAIKRWRQEQRIPSEA